MIPETANRPDWPRLVKLALDKLNRRSVQHDGQAIYTAPTISNPPTQAEVQAIADALAAVSDRLE